MSNFFDLKARKAANATASSSKNKHGDETPRAQPWVEK